MTTELKNRIERIMSYCQTQADIYNNYQLGTKVVINGIYGAFGFSGFYFYNKNIAESVTKQGKHAILNAESLINKWAQKVWLKDKKTHKMMGIKIKPGCENIDIKSITRYIDTDSLTPDSNINILDDVIIINDIAYNVSDSIRIMRNGVEMVVSASDIQKTDLIWQEHTKN
jgi:DNA polymerase elongation subunit (family B)